MDKNIDQQLSVIIPVYNGGDHLDRALTLLGFSEAPPLECIVVDDGSTDDSVAIAKRHGATVLSTEGRCGPARARNIGAEAAKGAILLFIDSDVAVYPETLSKVLAEFAADPDLDAVMGSYDEDLGAELHVAVQKPDALFRAPALEPRSDHVLVWLRSHPKAGF